MLPLLQSFRRSPTHPVNARLRRALESEFSYRGTATLEIRQIEVVGERIEIAVYARPLFPGDRKIGHRSREVAFAEQTFADCIGILGAAWQNAGQASAVDLTVWVRPILAPETELMILSTHTAREHAAFLVAAKRTAGWSAVEVLRRLPTRSRIDRLGKLGEEGPLQ